jgi:hypothetical protein
MYYAILLSLITFAYLTSYTLGINNSLDYFGWPCFTVLITTCYLFKSDSTRSFFEKYITCESLATGLLTTIIFFSFEFEKVRACYFIVISLCSIKPAYAMVFFLNQDKKRILFHALNMFSPVVPLLFLPVALLYYFEHKRKVLTHSYYPACIAVITAYNIMCAIFLLFNRFLDYRYPSFGFDIIVVFIFISIPSIIALVAIFIFYNAYYKRNYEYIGKFSLIALFAFLPYLLFLFIALAVYDCKRNAKKMRVNIATLFKRG